MYDVVIVGAGPAGISAAIYIKRAGYSVLVIHNNESSLLKAEKVDNYYGFAQGLSGADILRVGIEQAKQLGIEIAETEAVGVRYDGNFTIKTTTADFSAKALILALGSKKKTVEIENLKKFEGSGVSYCAVCDAFFYKGKDICVLGNGEFALSEIKELKKFAGNIYLLTNGETINAEFPNDTEIITKKILRLTGELSLDGVAFSDGTDLKTNGLFVALGTAGASELAKELGVVLKNDKIAVDDNMKTSVKGVFAAGDCIGGVLQVSVAVGEGAKAGLSAVEYLRDIKNIK